ncbi:hypothetical protein Dimus_025723 [Dionaea muscipula]
MAPTDIADFDLRASPPSGFVSSELAFADVNNLEHCAKYLNQTLVSFGFPASLDLFAADPVRFGCVFVLFQVSILRDVLLILVVDRKLLCAETNWVRLTGLYRPHL